MQLYALLTAWVFLDVPLSPEGCVLVWRRGFVSLASGRLNPFLNRGKLQFGLPKIRLPSSDGFPRDGTLHTALVREILTCSARQQLCGIQDPHNPRRSHCTADSGRGHRPLEHPSCSENGDRCSRPTSYQENTCIQVFPRVSIAVRDIWVRVLSHAKI